MRIPDKAEVYARWYNPNCGFELEPDKNVGPPQTSENGILFHSTFLMLLDMKYNLTYSDGQLFLNTVERLATTTDGVYDRGAGDSQFIDYKIRNDNSHDNYLGIITGMYFRQNSGHENQRLRKISRHAITHFFIFNNVKPRFILPYNPGNWSAFLAGSYGQYKFLQTLFFPFLVLNFFITMFVMSSWEKFRGKEQSSSGKILYLQKLYTFRHVFLFKTLYNIYVRRMRKLFGDYFVEEIMKIYYRHPEHPNRLYAMGIKLEEVK